MGVDLDFTVRLSGRPARELTRRDVARALLAVPSGQALVSLSDLRRELLAAGNPLSAAFWESARTTLTQIESGVATVGDVQRWVESTGTEPILLTRSFFVWPEEGERGPVASEMYERLVTYLEGLVAEGAFDVDALAAGDPTTRKAYEEIQERWLSAPLADGRVPSEAVNDEQDAELFAAWDEEEAYALDELRRILGDLPEPPLPVADLRNAAIRLRETLATEGYPGNVLRACAGFDDGVLPPDDVDLWLSVVAGIAAPVSDLPDEEDAERFFDLDHELSHEDSVIASLCAIHHADWLAAVTTLARYGPGVLASPERLARFIADSEDGAVVDGSVADYSPVPDDELDNGAEPYDVEATEMLFTAVTPLWAQLGVLDRAEVLTPLGWWGLPKALLRAWSHQD